MTDYTFIKDPSLLEEDHRVEDLLDFSANINSLTEQLIRIKKNSMVGLIGPYGCGKSTLLYQIYKDEGGANENVNAENIAQIRNAKWLTFDAWKYPERKDLWDGFVIDVAMQMSNKQLKKIKLEIEGEKNAKAKKGVKIVSQLFQALATIKEIPVLSNVTGGMQEILVGALSSPPIKRVYEFQELLGRMIDNIDQDVYIVVEDVDRSGDQGIFFLETLRHFIKNIESKHKIIVIVPMGEEVFQKQDNNMARDSYLKVLDYQVKFNPEDIKFDKFIQAIIDVEKFKATYYEDPSDITKMLFHFFSHAILANREGTIRDIKHLLRLADNNYSILKKSDNERIEPMLVLFFTASRYFCTKNGQAEKYYFKSIPPNPRSAMVKNMQQIPHVHRKHWLYSLILVYIKRMEIQVLGDHINNSEENTQYYFLVFEENSSFASASLCNRGSISHKLFILRSEVIVIYLNNKYRELILEESIPEIRENEYIEKSEEEVPQPG